MYPHHGVREAPCTRTPLSLLACIVIVDMRTPVVRASSTAAVYQVHLMMVR